MKNKYLNFLLIVLILAFGLWLRTYNLGNRYTFEWDQNDDVVKVMKILEGQPTLIGPRVAGPDSFFVAPWHYYFLVPFYAVGKGDPISGSWAAISVGMATILAYYWVGSRLWGKKEGLVAAWAGAASYSIVSWNVMYTPLLSIIIFFLGNRLLEGKKYFWLAVALAIFAGTTHLVPATLLIMILATYLLIKNKPPVKNILLGFLIGLLWLVPLVLFDLRHDFLIFNKVILFFTAKGEYHEGVFNLLAWRAFYRGFSLTGGSDFNSFWYIFERVFLAITVIAVIVVTKDKQKKIWYSLWFVFPAIILLFYWKNIPEYYFGVPIALIPLFLSLVTKKFKPVITLFLIVVSIIQANNVFHQVSWVSLNDKKAVVTYMTNYAKDRHYNFSYDVPFGEEVGYPYLFKWMKHEPENIPEARLYTLSRSPLSSEKVIYSKKGLNIIER
ncbi:TPA: hypothetical protein DEP81_01725 [Candidatus Woesebacteria bacterium]|nr:hypothetical protein [Candidatus Woesebacteria bacterium]